MRRLLAALAAVGVLGGLPAAWAGSRNVRSSVVVCTATLAHVARGDINRNNLTLQNVGTLHVNVGRKEHAGANFQGLTLHVGAAIEFRDFQSGLECQTQPGTGETAVEVLEELK